MPKCLGRREDESRIQVTQLYHDNDDDKNVTNLNIQPIKNKRFSFF